MATCDYSADSVLLPPSCLVFAAPPDLIGCCVFVFEQGLMPARGAFPNIPFID